jgi:uncharacterized protein (TIGR02594 family)
MIVIPEQYAYLLLETAPKMLIEALKLHGTKEKAGTANNPQILAWAKELGIKQYNADSIPWCGLAMAIVAFRAGKQLPKDPLYALNWGTFGNPVDEPMLGDILTFKRFDAQDRLIGGHVGLYVGETAGTYLVLGGNQKDSFCIVEISKKRLFKARRPVFQTAQPANVRKMFVNSSGVLSTNEA